MKKVLMCLVICICCFITCTKDKVAPDATNEVVITFNQLSSITNTIVQFDVTIESDGGNPITERGVVVDKYSLPTIKDLKDMQGSGLGRFIDTIGNLLPNTVYYMRPFATNSLGTVYGEEQTFMTLLTTPVLQSPANGAQQRCCSVSFQWTNIAGATQYDIEIARNAAFSGSAISIPNCTGSTSLQYNSVNRALTNSYSFCVRAGTATNNGTWYWRVRARNTTNFSSWSSTRTFNYLY
jgi:hypothetical protein